MIQYLIIIKRRPIRNSSVVSLVFNFGLMRAVPPHPHSHVNPYIGFLALKYTTKKARMQEKNQKVLFVKDQTVWACRPTVQSVYI
jgi:hypothetical protein